MTFNNPDYAKTPPSHHSSYAYICHEFANTYKVTHPCHITIPSSELSVPLFSIFPEPLYFSRFSISSVLQSPPISARMERNRRYYIFTRKSVNTVGTEIFFNQFIYLKDYLKTNISETDTVISKETNTQ